MDLLKSITYGAVFVAAFICETTLIPYYETIEIYNRAKNDTKKYYK